MMRFLTGLMALLLFATPAFAQKVSQLPSAPAPAASAIWPIVQDGVTYKAGPQWQRSALGVSKVRSLESFATALGVQLGTSDDGAVFAAANAAITAAKASGGLVVEVPPGTFNTSVNLTLDNRGGYECAMTGACLLKQIRASDSAAETCFVSLADSYATNWLFRGFVLHGGWSYGRAPYAGSPASDPWLLKQHGVCMMNAFNSVDDARYRNNSPIRSANPHGILADVLVSHFGGDLFRIEGSGAQFYSNLGGYGSGGRGFYCNSYDNDGLNVQVGETGRAGIWVGPNCSSNRFTNWKSFYAGGLEAPDDCAGLHIDRGGGNVFSGFQLQDMSCDGIVDSGGGNIITASVGWQGYVGNMQAAPLAMLKLKGANLETITLNGGIFNYPFETVTKLIRDLDNGSGVYAKKNRISITATGFPGDVGAWNPAWFEGPLDNTNQINFNAFMRQPREFVADSSGDIAFAASMGGSAAGLIIRTPTSGFTPGAVVLIGQARSGIVGHASGPDVSAFEWDENGKAFMPHLPGPYADDAAAEAAGLLPFQLYRDSASAIHVCAGC